jgi:hypothetical protein
MTAFLEGGRGAVVMTNGDRGGWIGAEILRSIAREYGWPVFQPREKTVVPVDPASLAALTGRYEIGQGRALDIVLDKGALFIVDGEERVELYPESATRFFELVEEHQIDFVKGADGKASHMLIDGRLKAPRIGE